MLVANALCWFCLDAAHIYVHVVVMAHFVTERESSGSNSTSGDSDVDLHWTNPESTSSYDYLARRSPRPSTSSLSSSDNSTTMSAPAQTHSTPPSPVPHAHNAHNERLRSVG
jgi:hypothetical protein